MAALSWLLFRLLGQWMWPLMVLASLGMVLPRIHPRFGKKRTDRKS